jgi:spore coat protein U-like protein
MLKHSLKLAMAGALVMAAGTAGADTKTTTLNVSAKVAANCSVTAPNLAFSDYDASADVDGSTVLKVNCSKGTTFDVLLGDGTHGDISQRLMKEALTANFLAYNLYLDAGRTAIWGENLGVDTAGNVGAGMSATKAVDVEVFGRIPNTAANQDAPAGDYSDAVLVTVSY